MKKLGYFSIEGDTIIRSSKNSVANEFILDNASTSHIIRDLSSFFWYKKTSSSVHWGNASKLNILGIGHCLIQFKDTKKRGLLKNALHVLDLGVNLISQSKMVNNFTIRLPNIALIVNLQTCKILTRATIRNGLYYLPIRILKPEP